jgi:hypothetical protein
MEVQISTARAWVNIMPTGEAKPDGHIGAFVPDSYANMKASIETLNIRCKELEQTLKTEIHRREEGDLIIANQVASIKNLLRNEKILKDNIDRIEDAHSTLLYCQICFERQRKIKLTPCNHVVTCQQCTDKIVSAASASQRRCPICRSVITHTDVALII